LEVPWRDGCAPEDTTPSEAQPLDRHLVRDTFTGSLPVEAFANPDETCFFFLFDLIIISRDLSRSLETAIAGEKTGGSRNRKLFSPVRFQR
jgi:hypothetical protein